MTTIINHLTAVQVYALIAIGLGICLAYWIKQRNYNRVKGIDQREPLPFFWASVVGLLEWSGTWLYRLLIAFGVFFLVLVWFNHQHPKPPLHGVVAMPGK